MDLIQLHSEIVGLTLVKGAPGRAAARARRGGDPRVMFADISPPVGTRVAGAQVTRVRRHGRGDGLGTWVCEQRMCESEAATNGVRGTGSSAAAEEVGARGQRLMDRKVYSHEYAVYAYDTG